MGDLFYEKILYIGEEEDIIGFMNKEKDIIKKVNGKSVIYRKCNLWGDCVRDTDFNKYNDSNYNPIGINEEYDRSIDILFNTFNKMGYKEFEEKGYKVEDKHIKDMRLFMEYIFKCICSSDFKIFKYFLCWLSDIVRKPKVKCGICCVFYSLTKKTGKGDFSKFLNKGVGNDNSLFSDIDNLFGRFDNNGETILSIYDELNRDSFNKRNYNKLKGMITEVECEKEKKGVDIKRGYDYNRFILLSNELNFLSLDTDETRFFILNFLKLWGEDFNKYKKTLNRIYKEDIYSVMFWKMLEGLEYDMVDRTDWCSSDNKPKTEVDSLVKSLNIIEQYLRDLYCGVNEYTYSMKIKNEILTVGMTDLYECFKMYYSSRNTKDKHFSYITFQKVFNTITMDYRKMEIKKNKEYISLDLKGLLGELKNREVVDMKIKIETIINFFIDEDNTLTDEEKKVKKEDYKLEMKEFKKCVKKNNYTIKKEERNIKEEVKSNETLFNDFMIKFWSVKKVKKEEPKKVKIEENEYILDIDEEDKIEVIVKKTKKVITIKKKTKKVVKKTVETIEYIDEESGEVCIMFGECMLD